MLIPIVLPLFEQAINRYLSCDPEIRTRLQPLSKRVLRIDVTTINCTAFLIIHNEKIQLRPHIGSPIDAVITGSPFALMNAGIQSWQGKVTPPRDIEMSGDLHFIQTITDI